MEKRNLTAVIVAAVVAALVFGGGGFAGGWFIGRRATGLARMAFRNGDFPGAPGGNFPGGGNGQRRMGGMVSGKVISVDADSITVQLPDGGSRTVYTSSSTTYSKFSDATASDVSKDTTITVVGDAGSNNTVTATRIMIGGGFFGFGGPRPAANQ